MTVQQPLQVSFDSLVDKITQWVDEFPDIHSVATDVAREILALHTDLDTDPNKIYWHRFDSGQGSTKTYNGWMHDGYPIESMTLVELVIKRFKAKEQMGIDDLNLWSGFYTDDSTHTLFDESNEVRLLAADVQAYLWEHEFAKTYQKVIDDFWLTQGEFYCALCKMAMLDAAVRQFREGAFLAEDFLLVYSVVIADLNHPFTPSQLLNLSGRSAQPDSLRTFQIGDYAANSIVRVVADTGRQILYCPRHVKTFQVFDNEQQMYAWVQAKAGNPKLADRFISQFLRHERQASADWAKMRLALSEIAEKPWHAGQTLLCHTYTPLDGISMEFTRKWAKAEQQADAAYLLTTNAQLDRQLWIGYMNAFMGVFGALAPLSWPVALSMVGAGLLNVGLNSYEAVKGKTTESRKAAIRSALINALNTLLNVPLLRSSGELAELSEVEGEDIEVFEEETNVINADVELEPTVEVPVAEELDNTPVPVAKLSVEQVNLKLEPYRSDIRLRADNIQGTKGRFRKIWLLEGDGYYIVINRRTYQVRVIDNFQHVVIVDPLNPYSFYGALPVELDAAGEWQLLPAQRLKGGGGLTPHPLLLNMTRASVQMPMDDVIGMIGRYAVPTPRGNMLAVFDADQACWRLDHLGASDLAWKSAAGPWVTGNNAVYAATKAYLPRPLTIKKIVLPSLPPVPITTTPVPKLMHYIWIGEEPIGAELLDNIVANARKMPTYTTMLHMDVQSVEQIERVTTSLKSRVPGLQVSLLKDDPFFDVFKASDNAEQYRLSCESLGRNYSSASNILRFPLVDHYGGLFMELDDSIVSVSQSDLPAQANDILLNDAVQLDDLQFAGYTASHFASHANNPVLKAISKEMSRNFRLNQGFYEKARPVLVKDADGVATAQSLAAVNAYEKEVFALTGPSLFNVMLKSERPDYYDLMLRKSLKEQVGVISNAYDEQLDKLVEHYFPFAEKLQIEIGNAHSWLHTR
ncbi:MAG: hypothetical protein PW845_12685 [Pseudomonas sp.]|nr:hypothetical protein [Pseudomonas sp.]